MTALLDAIGKTIVDTGKWLAAKAENDRPEKVIFVILTDGHENSSKEFTRQRIFEMIRHQEGQRGRYTISPYCQTLIEDRHGKCIAYACLQLSIPAPTYDRMVAEYLLIKNDENLYWKTANVFPRQPETGWVEQWATAVLVGVDAGLLTNLILTILQN